MHTFDTKYQNYIYAVVTNKDLTDDERSKIIADLMSEFEHNYPDLQNTATKSDLTQVELKLVKEIEDVRLEIKNLEIKSQVGLKEMEINFQKDTESIKLEIKNVESSLKKDIEFIRQDTESIKLEIKNVESSLKKDIESIRLEIKDVDSNLRKDMKEMEGNLRKDIESIRLEIKDVEINLQKELSKHKTDILKWMFGMFVTFGGMFFMLFRIFGNIAH